MSSPRAPFPAFLRRADDAGQPAEGHQPDRHEGHDLESLVELAQRRVLGAVDLGQGVGLHRQLGVELADAHLLPGLLVGVHVAPEDVLVEADAERELLDAGLVDGRHLRLRLPRAQGLDGLQEEVQGDQDVGEQVDAEDDLQGERLALERVERVGGEEEHDVDRGHDHEGEARLVVGEVDEVVRLVHGVGQGPVPLPGIQVADGVLPLLLLLLAELAHEADGVLVLPQLLVRARRGDGDGERGGRERLWRDRVVAGPAVVFVLVVGVIGHRASCIQPTPHTSARQAMALQ